LIVTPDNEYWFRKLPIESINATGDGDAFAAPLTVALLEKRSWEAMGAWGSAAVVEDN
jgi:sugar/nucleoside kinase (ribokinase family)